MTAGVLFWVLMILWLVFGLWWNWPGQARPAWPYAPFGNALLTFILLALLGWHVFGPALR